MAEDLALRERVKRLQARFDIELMSLQGRIAVLENGNGPGHKVFATLSELLASDATRWSTAEATNYSGTDGILTLWYVTSSSAAVPNGTDILQTTAGITIVRYFVREAQ